MPKNKSTGLRKLGAGYSFRFTDSAGRERCLTGFNSISATDELRRHILVLVDAQTAREKPQPATSRYFVKLNKTVNDKRIIDRLVEWHVLDAQVAAQRKTLIEMVADYQAAMERNQLTSHHIRQTIKILNTAFSHLRIARFADLNADAVDKMLFDMRSDKGDKKGLSARTSNLCLATLNAFCNWLVINEWATDNPLTKIELLDVATDQRVNRRPLTSAEINALLVATVAEPLRFGLTGKERALLYRLAIETGLRWGETYGLIIGDLSLNDEQSVLFTRPEIVGNKSGKREFIPLRSDFAAELRAYVDGRPLTERVFVNQWVGRGAKMIRMDLAAAGIPYKDENGAVVDFHSLRKTTGTELANNGANSTQITHLMRHSSIAVTEKHYIKTTLAADAAVLKFLPNIGEAANKKNTVLDAKNDGDNEANPSEISYTESYPKSPKTDDFWRSKANTDGLKSVENKSEKKHNCIANPLHSHLKKAHHNNANATPGSPPACRLPAGRQGRQGRQVVEFAE